MAVVTTLTLMVVPVTYWLSRDRSVHDDIGHQVGHVADEIGVQLRDRLRAIELVLRGIRGFVEGSDDVTEAEFEAFVQSLALPQTVGGVLSVSYLVRQEAVAAPPAAESAGGNLRLAGVLPAHDRAYQAVVRFVAPTAGNQDVLGFDIFRSTALSEAALRAQDTGQVALSRRVTGLVYGEPDHRAMFAMYAPIYRAGSAIASPAARRAALQGWAGARFRLVDVLARDATLLHDGIRLQLFEGPTADASTFLLGWLGQASETFVPDLTAPYRQQGLITFGGQRWTYVLTPTSAFIVARQSRDHHVLALLGLALSLAAGVIVWLLMTARDRARRAALAMTRELRVLSADLESTLNAVPDLLLELDGQGHVLAVRPGRQTAWLLEAAQVAGQGLQEILPASAHTVVTTAMTEARHDGVSKAHRVAIPLAGQVGWYELWMAAKSATEGADPRFLLVVRDITDAHVAQEQLRHLAFFDELTGLPNRRQFMRQAGEALSARGPTAGFGAAILVDMDHFKVINENWGSTRGDLLLQEAARRLTALLPAQAMVARLDGDEFILLLEALGSDRARATQAVDMVCQRVLASLRQPVVVAHESHRLDASLGAAVFDPKPLKVEELLSQVGAAVQAAKGQGRNAYCFFDGRLQAALVEQTWLKGELRRAIEQQDLFLVYQSQVDAAGRVVGAEALCRWQHPSLGAVSPAVFIALAESTGLILPLGHWVLERACQFRATWQDTPALAGLTVSVNVSARQFHQVGFVAQVAQVIQRTGIPPAALKLELTESVFANDMTALVNKMHALRDLGVRLALDDFGTGYSSLRYLKDLPLDQLKIDQAFVRDVRQSPNAEAIVRTVIALGQSLGLEVIAEGVDSQEQTDWLRRNGCTRFQGYLFGRPVAEPEWLASVAGAG